MSAHPNALTLASSLATALVLVAPLPEASAAELVLAVHPDDPAATIGAAPTLQQALNQAREGDTITLRPGVYRVNLSFPRRAITLRGDPGAEAGSVILDGSGCLRGVSECSVIAVDWTTSGGLLPADGPTPVLEDLTVTGGQGRADLVGPPFNPHGGGVWLGDANPTLSRVVVTANQAYLGGGIFTFGGAPILSQVILRSNQAEHGGGMYLAESSGLLEQTRVEGNRAAYDGGGLCLFRSSPSLSHVSLIGNRAEAGGGANLYESQPSVRHLVVEGNTAGEGGGMYLWRASPTMEHVQILRNKGGDGGGLYLWQCAPALVNAILSGNLGARGGGSFVADAALTLSQATVTGNLAVSGGGLYLRRFSGAPAATLHNTVIAMNLGDAGPNLVVEEGGAAIFDHALLWQPSGASGVEGAPLDDAPYAQVADPLFYDDVTDGALRDDDAHLRPGSPAVDAGAPTCWDPQAGAFDLPCADPDGSAPDLGVFGGPESTAVDLDGDQAPDDWEAAWGLDTTAGGDADGDGLSDADELKHGTSPVQADSDGDGRSDAQEVAEGTDPRDILDPPLHAGEPGVVYVPQDVPSLEEALAVTGPGGIIRVGRGRWAGAIELWHKDLTVESTGGPLATTLDAEGEGAALTLIAPTAAFTLRGFTLTGGDAEEGGGLSVRQGSGLLEDLIIEGNRAQVGGGAFILRAKTRLHQVVARGNEAAGNGGGIYVYEGSPSASHLRLEGNVAGEFGGGVAVLRAPAVFTQLIVQGNTAADSAGGIFVTSSPAVFSYITVVNNQAKEVGGGMWASSTAPILHASLLAFNRADYGGNLFGSGAPYPPDINHSLFYLADGTAGILYVDLSGEGNVVADPQLVGDGPNPSRLGAGSPAVDAGGATCWDPATGAFDEPCADADGSPADAGAWGGPGAAAWDADADGAPAPWWPTSADGSAAVTAGYDLSAFDCDDADPAVSPAAQELPGDALDNDCDGAVDEEDAPAGCDGTPGEGGRRGAGVWMVVVAAGMLRRRGFSGGGVRR